MRTNNKNQKVIVLGGGLAGLSAAFELVKSGIKVVVIEKEKQLGGLAKTIEVNGFRFDTGPHRWYTKNTKINKWMLEVLGNKVIDIPRLTRIYFDKKFFYYPIRIMNALSGMGFLKSIKAVSDYFFIRLTYKIKKKEIRTLEEGYINKFGATLYETFFKRYTEKLWGRKCTEISADWIGQRTRGFNIGTILKETLSLSSKKTVSFVDMFKYPVGGIGELSEKLALNIKKLGGEILLNTEASKIYHKNGEIISIEIKNKGKKQEIRGENLISSIPLSDLVNQLTPKAPSNILDIANKLQYRDELQVALFVKKSNITPDTWIYIHPAELPFVRVMEMDNWDKKLSPKGTTTLVFEIACNEGDKVWERSDKEVLDLVTNSYLKEFGFIRKKDIIGGHVDRTLKEYPVYHLGYKEDTDKIKSFLKGIHNLQIVGRNGTFKYNNMDHSIEMGLYAAWNIIAGKNKYDIESVNIEREYLEEKKIENIEDENLEESSQ